MEERCAKVHIIFIRINISLAVFTVKISNVNNIICNYKFLNPYKNGLHFYKLSLVFGDILLTQLF